MAGTCECGNELLGSIKCGEFLDQLKTGQLFKKDSAPSSKCWNIKKSECHCRQGHNKRKISELCSSMIVLEHTSVFDPHVKSQILDE